MNDAHRPPSAPSAEALRRYSVLAQVEALILGGWRASAAMREVATRDHVDPHGRLVRVSVRTIQRWRAAYAEGAATLAHGDVLVLYTDGITEVFNANEEEFGEERLERLVVQHASQPADRLANLIVETAAAFGQEQGAFDDETLVVIKRSRRSPVGSRATISQ